MASLSLLPLIRLQLLRSAQHFDYRSCLYELSAVRLALRIFPSRLLLVSITAMLSLEFDQVASVEMLPKSRTKGY